MVRPGIRRERVIKEILLRNISAPAADRSWLRATKAQGKSGNRIGADFVSIWPAEAPRCSLWKRRCRTRRSAGQSGRNSSFPHKNPG